MKTKKNRSECADRSNELCTLPCTWIRPRTRIPHCKIASTHKTVDGRIVLRNPVSSISTYPSYLLMSEDGEFTTFGIHAHVLNDFFHEYSFQYVQDVHRNEILFLKHGITSYATLHKASDTNTNLMYDYVVGVHYINRILSRFPCFMYTYGLYYTTSPHPLLNSKRSLQSGLARHDVDYATSCEDPPEYIMMQHLHGSIPLSKVEPEYLLNLLFIVYHALASLDSFTHHQLTLENIMVWRPHTKSIRYVYGTTTFTCPYIPKIVNYGSAYFSNVQNSTELVYQSCGYRHLQDKQYNPRKDVGLMREIGFDIPQEATVKDVYIQLKKWLPSVSEEYFGTLHVYGRKPCKFEIN